MSDNTKIWDALAKTNPEHTKGFKRAGGFSGTAVKPIYCDQRMTEQFGPCGLGWGIEKPEFQLVSAGNEILVYCTVAVWHGNKDCLVYGVGGDKVMSAGSNGARTSDEAFKMAFTDAIGNAMKHLGMSADIHMGMFDDQKYVRELKEEFSQPAKPEQPKPDQKPKTFWEFDSYALTFKDHDDFVRKFVQGCEKAPTLASISKLQDDNEETIKAISEDRYKVIGAAIDTAGERIMRAAAGGKAA